MDESLLRIANIIEESIVDGPGIRFTVFTQGCLMECPGCQNPQTWDINGGEVVSISGLADRIRSNPLLDGVTLSGGEPFLQTLACAQLAEKVKSFGLNVMAYSGYTFESLYDGGGDELELLKNLDILVDGPFIMEEKSLNLSFKGSRNQRTIDVPGTLLNFDRGDRTVKEIEL
ncbi:MAG: anaerobic ribonucleoside-triphosphate reductase activating protein [Clostridiales bacterium]|jgi:anaerobic ribonucleoside-triphosphate reductase activating protein|nr:anaerobic ribonucleoside-triphosphate reductase activating protein [Clostridiales bacterium]